MNWFKNLFKKEPEMITVYSYRAISIKWEINDAKEVEAEYMRGTHFKEIFYD